ncbi:hypothetical protein Hanom_Chr17g01551201 [Helianthus anomalus]
MGSILDKPIFLIFLKKIYFKPHFNSTRTRTDPKMDHIEIKSWVRQCLYRC